MRTPRTGENEKVEKLSTDQRTANEYCQPEKGFRDVFSTE